MSHECHHGSCSHKNHSHSHSETCCSCSEECSCCCECECHHHSHKYSDQLLALADEAWMELIKDQMKEEIKKHSGKHIAQMAQLVAKSNHARWTHKLNEKKNHQMYEDELNNLIFRQK